MFEALFIFHVVPMLLKQWTGELQISVGVKRKPSIQEMLGTNLADSG
jgi:hypothetical protein